APEGTMSPTRPRSKKSAKAAKAAEAAPAPPRPFVAHHLVPPHELLSEAEGAAALRELATSAERLPKILVSDPGLKTDPKFVAAKESGEPLAGRLVRIRRPSQTAGEAVAYRVLVPSLGE
ncbi:MAG TPA: DNA-directed RNA polymerase subunit RpoH/Rpb5 C-terminal domain-containing protein, partial [Thermoplasmata archaeon]|nr:DNA-directed RNA polymerase subunit RpoH/Rpb5 C-terminal domain-containing protein [Thermoplasmata archaeon]